jgi:acetyl esterase
MYAMIFIRPLHTGQARTSMAKTFLSSSLQGMGLPPAILIVGTLNPLLSDSQLFAAALQKAGVPAELNVYEDGIHAFLQIPTFDMTRDALEKIAAFVRSRFAGGDAR